MNISSFLGLETALRGLTAQQRALDTTGHNIANASTTGYSRQTAVMRAAPAMLIPGGGSENGGVQLGTGVDVVAFNRIRDGFLDLQYRAQAMRLGGAETRTRSLDQVELALAEPGDNGLSAQLARFWSAWSELSNSPDSAAARQALLDQSRQLASSVNALDAHLAGLQGQAATQTSALLAIPGDVHSAANELAALNDAIAAGTARGAPPSDLMDRRDLVLDRLAQLAQVRVEPAAGRPGAVTVYFADTSAAATPLVDGSVPGSAAVRAWPLTVTAAAGGELGALASLADQTSGPLAGYRAELATFARTLATAVNREYTQNGTLAPGFFVVTPGDEAATLAVDPTITTATLRAGTTGPGDNSIALAIADLRGRPAPVNGADDAYVALVSRIGNDVRAAHREETNARVLTDAIENRRQSVAGVSMDEEMTNLVRFQRGYQASARVMSAMDEMLDTLVNRTGRVGL